jgi:hypothetical protein
MNMTVHAGSGTAVVSLTLSKSNHCWGLVATVMVNFIVSGLPTARLLGANGPAETEKSVNVPSVIDVDGTVVDPT